MEFEREEQSDGDIEKRKREEKERRGREKIKREKGRVQTRGGERGRVFESKKSERERGRKGRTDRVI